MPENSRGIVVFAHGSGSSRHSPRNRYVADVLNEAGSARSLFDLLTPEEELDRANVFDIELLARRLLVDVTGWLRAQPSAACAASATSVPAPAPRRRCGRRPSPAPASPPSYPVAAAPTLPAPGSLP